MSPTPKWENATDLAVEFVREKVFRPASQFSNLPAVRVFTMLTVGLIVGRLFARNWSNVKDDLSHLTALSLVQATALSSSALLSGWKSWSALLPAKRVEARTTRSLHLFFVSQMGKYVPGGVWPAVFQARMSRQLGIPAKRIFETYIAHILVTLFVGAHLACLILLDQSTPGFRLLGLAAAISALVIVLSLAIFVRREHDGGPRIVMKLRVRFKKVPANSIMKSGCFAVLAWFLFGSHLWVLAKTFGSGTPNVLFFVGAYSIAFILGMLVVPLPAGAGVRELVLISLLGVSIGAPAALVVAAVSRLILLVSDSLLAGISIFLKFAVSRALKSKDVAL